MAYKLKKNQPEFDVVDGPFAGKKYRHNERYDEVPPGDKDRFEVVKKPRQNKAVATVAAKKKDGSDGSKSVPAVNAKGGPEK